MKDIYFIEENFDDYINDNMIIGAGTESHIYKFNDIVLKILYSDFIRFYTKYKLKKIAKLNLDDIISSPIGFVYCDYKFIGYAMHNCGISLKDYLLENNISLDKKIKILRDTKDKIIKLHQLGMVHGDIQPGNILIDSNEIIRIGDINNINISYFKDMYYNNISYSLSFRYGNSSILDILTFNYFCYIILNYHDRDLSSYLTHGADSFYYFRYDIKDNKYFDENICQEQMNLLLNPRSKKYALNNTKYLIDYLK